MKRYDEYSNNGTTTDSIDCLCARFRVFPLGFAPQEKLKATKINLINVIRCLCYKQQCLSLQVCFNLYI